MLSMVPLHSQFNVISHHALPGYVDGRELSFYSHEYLKNKFELTRLPVTAVGVIPKKINFTDNTGLVQTDERMANNIAIFFKKHKRNRIKRAPNSAFTCPLKLNDLRTKISESKITFNREIFDQVNRNEVDINTQDKDNRTALMVAVLLGNGSQDVARLLEKGAELNYLDSDGNTALILAIMARENAIINVLLKFGANVNLAGNMALTPLMLAVIFNDSKLIDKLALKGIKPDLKNDDDDTALTLAIKNGASGKVIDSLLRLGIGVNVPGKGGLTPLLSAAGSGNKMFLNKILPLGAEVDALDDKGWTAMMRAVACGNQKIMKYLVERGAAVNVRDPNNATALSLALSRGHMAMAEILRKAGAAESHQAIMAQRPKFFAPQTITSTAKTPGATSGPVEILQSSTTSSNVDVMSINFHTAVKPACAGSSNSGLSCLPVLIMSSFMMIFNTAWQYCFRRSRFCRS